MMGDLIQSKNIIAKSFEDYQSFKKSAENDEPGESIPTELPF
jgi:hypothetical protein